MHLISNQMLQSLIVSWPKEYLNVEHLSCETVVHRLVSIPLVTEIMKLLGNLLDLLVTKRCGISGGAVKR